MKGIITVDQTRELRPLGKDQIPLARIEFPGDECKPLVAYLDVTGVALITREISLAEATILGIHHDRLGEQIDSWANRIARLTNSFSTRQG